MRLEGERFETYLQNRSESEKSKNEVTEIVHKAKVN